MAIHDDQYSAAIHESAHAVVAVHMGWKLGKTGVEINERWYTALSFPEHARNRQAPIYLCGRLAEQKRMKRKMEYIPQAELASIIDEYDLDLDDDEEIYDDLATLILFYKEQNPSAGANEFIARFNQDHEYTVQILNDEKIWNAIINFAKILYDEGAIEGDKAESIIQEYLEM